MARIAGVDIPNEKRIVISLQYIFGIGEPTSKKILADAGVSEDIRTRDLTEDQLQAIRTQITKYKVEGDLRREVALNIKRLMEIGCYRGIVIERIYLYVDKIQEIIPVHVKDQDIPLLIRRNNKGGIKLWHVKLQNVV